MATKSLNEYMHEIDFPQIAGYEMTMHTNDENRTVTLIYDDAERVGVHVKIWQVNAPYEPRDLTASVSTHSGHLSDGRFFYGNFEHEDQLYYARASNREVTRYSKRQMTNYAAHLVKTGWLTDELHDAVMALTRGEGIGIGPSTRTEAEDTTPAREGDYPLGTVAVIDMFDDLVTKKPRRVTCERVSTYNLGKRTADMWQVIDTGLAWEGYKFSTGEVVEVWETEDETTEELTPTVEDLNADRVSASDAIRAALTNDRRQLRDEATHREVIADVDALAEKTLQLLEPHAPATLPDEIWDEATALLDRWGDQGAHNAVCSIQRTMCLIEEHGVEGAGAWLINEGAHHMPETVDAVEADPTAPVREGDYLIGTVATVEVPGPAETKQYALCRRVSTRWMGEPAEDLWEVLNGEFAGFKFSAGEVLETHEHDPEAVLAELDEHLAEVTAHLDDVEQVAAIDYRDYRRALRGVTTAGADTHVQINYDVEHRRTQIKATEALLATATLTRDDQPEAVESVGDSEPAYRRVAQLPSPEARLTDGTVVDVDYEYGEWITPDGRVLDAEIESVTYYDEANKTFYTETFGRPEVDTIDDVELTVMTQGHATEADFLAPLTRVESLPTYGGTAPTIEITGTGVDVVYRADDDLRYRVMTRGNNQLAVYYVRPDGTGEGLGYVQLTAPYTGHRRTAAAGRLLAEAFDKIVAELIETDLRARVHGFAKAVA